MRRIIFVLIFLLGFLQALLQVNAQGAGSYSLSTNSIVQPLKLGTFAEVPIIIANTGDSTLTIRFGVDEELESIVSLSANTLELGANEIGNVTLGLFAENLSTYLGDVILRGDISEEVFVNVTVRELDIVPVDAIAIEIDILKNRVQLGDMLRFEVEVQNLLTNEQYEVKLHYSIDNSEGQKSYLFNKSFLTESETIRLSTSQSLLKEFTIPPFLKHGDYVLNVKAEFLGLTSSVSRRFSVVEAILDYQILGILSVRWILFTGIFVVLGAIGFIIYRRRKAKQRRYATEVHYNLLPKPGSRSMYIGQIAESKRKTYFELEQLTTHTLIAGSTGGGKTVSAEVMVEEALMKDVAVICFDPTAQWTGFLRKNTQKKMFALYPKFGLKKKDARAFNGNVRQILDAREIIEIAKFMKPGEINVFSVSKLDPKDIDTLVANTVRQVFRANLDESPQLRLLVIFDEVHRLLPKFGGSGEGFLQIERAAREFRKWGVGLFLISQVLTDFVGTTKANINTEIQMRTRDQGDLDRIKEKYGGGMLQSLLKAATGTGMLENSAYNKGNPYFVAFRPLLHNHARLTDKELEHYNKYNEIIDELDYQIEQLEGEKLDVFDMKLELKMALDKVKSGSFNMVDIYLEGLKPRLKGEWEKLGKQPKKKQTKLVTEEELVEEWRKADEAHAKAEKEGVGGEGSPGSQILKLPNGTVLTEPIDLMNAIQGMNEETYSENVVKPWSSILEWIGKTNKDLADALKKAKTKDQIVKLLEKSVA